jgi:hypothetical protein
MVEYRRATAPESVEFVLRQFEDMKFLEATHLSGATSLSGVFHHMGSVENMLKRIRGALMNPEANWEEDYLNFEKWITELSDLSKHIEKAIFTFLEEIERTIVVADKRISRKPVNFFALHNFDAEMSDIQKGLSKIYDDAGRYGIEIPGDGPKGGAVTTPQPARSSAPRNIRVVGLESHKNCITERLLGGTLGSSVVVLVGNHGSGKSILAENICQRYVISCYNQISILMLQIKNNTYTPKILKIK